MNDEDLPNDISAHVETVVGMHICLEIRLDLSRVELGDGFAVHSGLGLWVGEQSEGTSDHALGGGL